MFNKVQSLINKLKKSGYHTTLKSRAVDMVCNMKVDEGLIISEYGDKTYSFCSAHCKTQFDGNPAQYID